MKMNTCCFTGHRRLPVDKIESILKRLSDEINILYHQGVTEYISGGAIGFDQIAASMIIAKREMGSKMRLTFALPCENQDELWTLEQRWNYRSLLLEADDIIYVSQEYTPDCMKKRNYFMVDHSAFCICALLNEKSGTGQTVRYAQKNGVKVINIVKR